MKIVFLVEQLINSGPENVVFNICNSIDKEKYTPIIFSLRGEAKQNSIEEKFKALKIEIVHFCFSTIDLEFKTKKAAIVIGDKFKEVNGDVLHVHCYHPQLIAKYLKSIHTIVTLHNISGEDLPLKKGKILGSYMKWRFDHAIPHIEKVVSISDYMTQYYSDMCKGIVKVSNGVQYRKDTQFDSKQFKASVGVDSSKRIVLVTGTLSERKNVSYLISELKESTHDFLCIVLGDGDKSDECIQIADGDNRFRFEGFKNNVKDYLYIADMYISASKSEGLPMSVLEALNMGVPCLLSAIPPHIEIQRNMNVNGVKCFELERGSLLKLFEKENTQDFNNTGIAKKANSLYSAEAMTKRYEQLYDELLKN